MSKRPRITTWLLPRPLDLLVHGHRLRWVRRRRREKGESEPQTSLGGGAIRAIASKLLVSGQCLDVIISGCYQFTREGPRKPQEPELGKCGRKHMTPPPPSQDFKITKNRTKGLREVKGKSLAKGHQKRYRYGEQRQGRRRYARCEVRVRMRRRRRGCSRSRPPLSKQPLWACASLGNGHSCLSRWKCGARFMWSECHDQA